MTVLGTITHEAGDLSEWTSTNTSGTNTCTATNAAALDGSYGLEAVLNSNFSAFMRKTISWPANNVIAWRWKFKIAALSNPSGSVMMATVRDNSTGFNNALRIQHDSSGGWKLYHTPRDNSSPLTAILSTQPSVGTQYTLELLYDRGTQTATAYLNGAQVAQLIDTSVGGSAWSTLTHWDFGANRQAGTPTATVYLDTLEWGDARIGTTTAGPKKIYLTGGFRTLAGGLNG